MATKPLGEIPSNINVFTSAEVETLLKSLETLLKSLPLPNESVTDAKVVKGRALVETGNAPEALTARSFNTPYTPSASRPTEVRVAWTMEPVTSFGAVAKLYIDGVLIQEFYADEHVNAEISMNTTFTTNPGQTWEIQNFGHAAGLHSSYTIK